MSVRFSASVEMDAYFKYAVDLTRAETANVDALVAQIYAQLPFPPPLSAAAFGPSQGTSVRSSQFAVQAGMDPRAVATLAALSRLPTEAFLTPAQVDQNLSDTFGPQAPGLARSIEKTYAVGMVALFAALQGADMQAILQILGNNPAAPQFAQAIMGLAQAMQSGDPQAIFAALQGAEAGAAPYVAADMAVEMALLNRFMREQYGLGEDFYGQGGFSGAVDRLSGSGYSDVPSGTFNGPSSEAGVNALRAAQSQVGVGEATGNNDGLPAQRYCGGQNIPWCASFVAWSFAQSGNPLPGDQARLASAPYMASVMQRGGKFHRGTPQPGDIIFFRDAGGICHTGIVESVQNGRVNTIEGNSSNRVARRSYPLGSGAIAGYARHGSGAAATEGAAASRMGGGAPVDRLFNAISGQESNGNHNAVNRDSGALGIGQVMPANVRAWSREALGYEISPETFKSRPDLQNQIVRFKLDQYYREGLRVCGGDEREAVRYAAAKWYSGDGNRRNNTRAQTYGGNSYPSIASYSDRVLRRYLA
jgi:hypothetical protein